MHPKDFRSAYLETVYTAGEISWVFSPVDVGLELYKGRRFALITAANPRSEAWSEAENAERNQRMRLEIAARGWTCIESVGSSPNGDWRENGCLIWDAPLDQVVKIGREYGQNAICHGEAGRVALVWCDDGETEWCYAKPVNPQ